MPKGRRRTVAATPKPSRDDVRDVEDILAAKLPRAEERKAELLHRLDRSPDTSESHSTSASDRWSSD
jgi:hypothetical protein